ncbi:MAG: acyl-CoA dehydrogenase family protein [Deltaproteobacteria bacterium]|jgi:citronellyl-CoA dehydrogenase|nr:acyl-CoA dehydrogenase family protein [Deltaproteobacteria bacterium]
MGKQTYFTKEHDQVRRAVYDFIKKEINPYIDDWEENGKIPLHDLFKKMGDLGFLGIRYDPRYGGQGLDYWYETVLLEELGHIECGGVAMAIAVQTNMATPAIAEFGSEYLKETYLRSAIAGEMVGSIAVTEPDAGSDVGAMRTTAQRDGDEFVINGSKTFITNGTQADFLTLLARTSEDPGYHSFGLFVVPTDSAGFSVSRKLDKLGMRSSDTAELFLDNLRIPAKNLIGDEREGFIIQMKQFQHERFSALPTTYVALRDLIALTVDHLRKRIVFGKPLIVKQVLRHRIAQWLTELECLQQLTYHIVRMKMAHQDVTREVSMGKLLVGQLSCRISSGCLQMFGGSGYMNEMRVSRAFRDMRLNAIGGGANEVMSDIIAKLEGL